MTHLWKSEETYTFDIPSLQRVQDVYWKNAMLPLEGYLKAHIPKITRIKFDEKLPLLHVIVTIPKYPTDKPFFGEEDVKTLLETYMRYANSSVKEISEWYSNRNRTNLPK